MTSTLDSTIKSLSAYPYNFDFDMNHTALIVIDMQHDFLTKGGFGELLGNDVSKLSEIVPTCKDIIETFHKLKLPVIYTIECHNESHDNLYESKLTRGDAKIRIGQEGPLGKVMIRGSAGSQVVPELAPTKDDWIYYKHGKGAFCPGDMMNPWTFDELLKKLKVKKLVFTGVTTEVCVQTTMREANDRGYDSVIVTDCTASYFPEFKESAIKMITAQGAIIGWSIDSKTIIKELLE